MEYTRTPPEEPKQMIIEWRELITWKGENKGNKTSN